MMLPHDAFLHAHDDSIPVIDTGFHRPHFDASYLVVEGGRGAFIDTGTNHSVPRLSTALDATGLSPDAVEFVIARMCISTMQDESACSCGHCRGRDSSCIHELDRRGSN